MRLVLGVGLIVLSATAALGQVEAHQATADEKAELERNRMAAGEREGQPPTEVRSPMLLDIPLVDGSGASIFHFGDDVTTFETRGTAQYVCDKARIPAARVVVGKAAPDSESVPVVVTLPLVSGWFRQSVDVTMSLVDADGSEFGHKTESDLTIGHAKSAASMMLTYNWFAGNEKTVRLVQMLSGERFAQLAKDGRPAKLRVLLTIRE